MPSINSSSSVRVESKRIVRDDLRAKDAQVPRLFSHVFTEDAVFTSIHAVASPVAGSEPSVGLQALTDHVSAHRAVQRLHKAGNFAEWRGCRSIGPALVDGSCFSDPTSRPFLRPSRAGPTAGFVGPPTPNRR
jgi:hypothetical protein